MSAREKPTTAAIPRLAFTREEAAASIGMSLDSFERHVQPHVRLVRRGKLVLVPVTSLEEWLQQEAGFTIPASSRRSAA